MLVLNNKDEVLNCYLGKDKKKTFAFNNKKYLVKFPDPIKKKDNIIYYMSNNFSEFVGSNIFKIIGLEVQNTLLGTYMYNKKEK